MAAANSDNGVTDPVIQSCSGTAAVFDAQSPKIRKSSYLIITFAKCIISITYRIESFANAAAFEPYVGGAKDEPVPAVHPFGHDLIVPFP